MMRAGRWITTLVILGAILSLIEIGLRLYEGRTQSLARWRADCVARASPPTPLNHRPLVGLTHQRLESAQTYGEFAGREYDENYDARGIKLSTLRPQTGDGIRVLFMGDSFIEGYDDANTVPQRAFEWIAAHATLDAQVIVLNAGYTSYSPLIYAVQARQLLPAISPDLLVLDIDETDFFDDEVRYRPLAVRDEQGGLMAIGRSEALRLYDGCSHARRYPLYLAQWAVRIYYEARLAILARQRRTERLFPIGEAHGELTAEQSEQMRRFSRGLDELFAILKEHLAADRILIVRHPHLGHLQTDRGVPGLNRKLGDLVGAAAARNGVAFFDAQDELAAQFGNHPERYYWNGDMHFNFDGIRAYADLLGREILRRIGSVDGEAELDPKAARTTAPR